MFMYRSGEGVLAVHGRSRISNNASHYVRPTSTSSAGTNNSSSLFSHRLRRRRGHPAAITTSAGSCVRSGFCGGARCFGLALCRNAPLRPGSQRSPSQPGATSREALAASRAQAGCLLSCVCSRMCVRRDFGQTDPCESTVGLTCPCCEV